MLPPGHIAAGYLTAEALLKITQPVLPQSQITELICWGTFFSFAPDLDVFISFIKVRAWWYKKNVDGTIHRRFYSHIPILWLAAGLLIYIFAPGTYYKEIGLLLWVCSWSHFLLDSIEYGVMWLWPFNKELWAFKDRGVRKDIQADSFFEYWIKMVKAYLTRWTFYCEIIIILAALSAFFWF